MDDLDRAVASYQVGRPFSVREVDLDEHDAGRFVRLRFNPRAFSKRVFEREWADDTARAATGKIRLLSVVEDDGGVLRFIGRQGSNLFVLSIERMATDRT